MGVGLSIGVGREYMSALKKIALLPMHKSVRILILLLLDVLHIGAQKAGYHTILLD
jgi:hypothetical protein